MKRIFILALAVMLLVAPAPRCRVTVVRGRAWLVCPCKPATLACDDWYRVPVYRGRR